MTLFSIHFIIIMPWFLCFCERKLETLAVFLAMSIAFLEATRMDENWEVLVPQFWILAAWLLLWLTLYLFFYLAWSSGK